MPEDTARLFTFQKTCMMDLFDEDGCYVPSWEGTGARGNHRVAYEYVSEHLRHIGLSQCLAPPVWTFETAPEELDLLATMLFSEHELAQSDFVTLELAVPEKTILRTSYGAWCDLYFDCLETGRIEDDGKWLDCDPANDDQPYTVQAIISCIRKQWIVSVEPLVVAEV
ncbi:hypothetical protein ABVF61_00880 [Roseibium sp. HPY-6]|uniref:hypothetical protein n=1 Tax=Roseibium sp. HPY-6 TaxID=3229852 RepID=UPI00338E3181